jgi:ribosome biogenesis GTP-binding protein ysxC
MVIKKVELEKVIGVTSKIPEMPYPEFAFAGKSNVGKSSLINALMNRKALARVSSQPGKTQTINYYNVNDKIYLVDLPGYGYTKVAVEVKAKWGKMVEKYLRQSKMLKYVFLLIDSRHKPSDNDIMMYEWIVSQGVTPIIVATKTDKLKRSQIKGQMELIMKTLNLTSKEQLLPFSSETKVGVNELWEIIEGIYPEQES